MAEAMIAGLLRGKQVAPNRIIASHHIRGPIGGAN
jgi:pyrroline-5-carboxylate reductase